MPTPLALFFYDAWRRSGLTLETIARRTKMSVPTVSAYFNGTRGNGGQRRTQRTLTLLAQAIDADVEQALELAGLALDPGTEQAIKGDPALSRRDRELVLALYRQVRRDR